MLVNCNENDQNHSLYAAKIRKYIEKNDILSVYDNYLHHKCRLGERGFSNQKIAYL
jgi:hypothetical protein